MKVQTSCKTVLTWMDEALSILLSNHVPEARANAEFIMAHALKTGRNEVRFMGGTWLTQIEGHLFWRLVERRAQRVPLAYVLGSQPFLDIELEVGGEVLIPRPETEEVAAAAAKLLAPRREEALHFLEIGTGSGAIAIALSGRFPNASIEATDISAEALALARKNAGAYGRSPYIWFSQHDLFTPWPQKNVDLVISNPPYIPTADLAGLEPEVRQEPALALDGGADGLEALRAIIQRAPEVLKPQGLLVLEIGSDQGPAVIGLLRQRGFRDAEIRKDMQGQDRIAIATKAAEMLH